VSLNGSLTVTVTVKEPSRRRLPHGRGDDD
jgi:hypothetical protein